MYETLYTAWGAAIEAFFGVPVIFAGVGGDTPETGQWVEAKLHTGQPDNYGTDDQGPSTVRGFIRLGMCGRPGVNPTPLYTLADSAIEEFKKGYVIDAPSNTRVYEPGAVGTILDYDDRVVVPVTIRFEGSYIGPV